MPIRRARTSSSARPPAAMRARSRPQRAAAPVWAASALMTRNDARGAHGRLRSARGYAATFLFGAVACSTQNVGTLASGDGGPWDVGELEADASVHSEHLSSMAERLGRAYCQRFQECFPQSRGYYPEDLTGCAAYQSYLWIRPVRMAAAIRTADPSSIEPLIDDCASALARHPCGSEFIVFHDTCRGLFAAETGEGGPCLDGAECRYGLYCSRTGGCGRCQPLPTLGEACLEHRCASDLGCKSDQCVPLVKRGDACGLADLCEPGTSCIQVNQERRCLSRPEEGEACGPGIGQCALFLQCPEGVCRRFSMRGVNESCAAASDACRAGLYCNPSETCAAEPELGESCGQGLRCAGGLRCLAGTCTALGIPGTPCGDDADCEPGSVCFEEACRPWFSCGP